MTTLASPPVLDESAHEFLARFLSHVASVTGYGGDRIVTLARVKALLLTALGRGDDASVGAWGALYRTIAEIVAASEVAGSRNAHTYLRSFIQENGDLAND